MKTRKLLACLFGAASLAAAAPSMAYNVQVDEFRVARGTNPAWFLDSFIDGLPPPNNPMSPPFVYSIGPAGATVGPETGGKLTLDTSNGMVGYNPLGIPSIVQQVMLMTDHTGVLPGDSKYDWGLKAWHSFTVSALFDYHAAAPKEFYGLRLGDYAPLPTSGDDRLLLGVMNAGGTPSVMFVQQDYVSGTQTTVGGLMPVNLPVGGFDQIRLSYTHSASSSGVVFASWDLLSGGSVVGNGVWGSTGTVFSNESYTQAGFLAVAPVPEPGTWTMLLAGLAALGTMARRRRPI